MIVLQVDMFVTTPIKHAIDIKGERCPISTVPSVVVYFLFMPCIIPANFCHAHNYAHVLEESLTVCDVPDTSQPCKGVHEKNPCRSTVLCD